jgi:hypothetical protein
LTHLCGILNMGVRTPRDTISFSYIYIPFIKKKVKHTITTFIYSSSYKSSHTNKESVHPSLSGPCIDFVGQGTSGKGGFITRIEPSCLGSRFLSLSIEQASLEGQSGCLSDLLKQCRVMRYRV